MQPSLGINIAKRNSIKQAPRAFYLDRHRVTKRPTLWARFLAWLNQDI